jgi:hypothetical protein
MTDILKPCPFCGGEADIDDSVVGGVPWAAVACVMCTTEGRRFAGADRTERAIVAST